MRTATMLSLTEFIAALAHDRAGLGSASYPCSAAQDGEVVRAEVLGLDVAAVMLPSEILREERVDRMNQFWDVLGEREALVIAVSRGKR
jgi:hypothetical protein